MANYITHDYGYNNLKGNSPLLSGKRVKCGADCWICGNECTRGAKFCPPCSADVHDARTRWAQKQRKLAKKKT